VKRVATGWESQLTIAVDSIIDRTTMMELCEAFFALNPPTRLKLRTETLSGTLEALTSGQADLALGVVLDANTTTGLQRQTLGTVVFVFAVSPGHPLAAVDEPLTDDAIRQYRAVAIADSAERGGGLTVGVLAGQDVFTVTDMHEKMEAHLRGLGIGFLPRSMAQPLIESGRLLAKRVARPEHELRFCYAWRNAEKSAQGRALQWWLGQVDNPVTRAALLGGRTAADRA
jgi:DNA-binding transcriptional LysR family regulator